MVKYENEASKPGKEYVYRGKKFSLAPSAKPIAVSHESWSWLDPEIEDFIKSSDQYRDFVLDDFTVDEVKRLKVGVRSRLKVNFRGSGVSLFSRSIYDKQGKLVAIKLQFAKRDKK